MTGDVKIQNREQLLSGGDIESKQIVLDIAEKTLQQLDAHRRMASIMRMEGPVLHIGSKSWDLSEKENVYVFGSGKACNAMAMAAEEILGDYMTKGISIVKIKENRDIFHKTDIYVGGHPLPNEEGRLASLKMLEIVDAASERDLFITLISGGSSALMGCPVDGITLEDEQAVTDVMLKSGANVIEINAVRRHISQMNGGRLAQRIAARGAEMIGFTIWDALMGEPTGDIGKPATDFYGTPIGPDNTTLEEARRVLRDFDIEDKIPASIRDYLRDCGPEAETPKSFPDFTYYVLNTVPDSCIYAKEIAEEMGVPAMILTTFIEGESREAGTLMASIAREIQQHGNPMKAPCVILTSGETSTRIPDSSVIEGHGGPSQELCASFAIKAGNVPGACMFSIDSEGTDGTTKLAGGLTDSKTMERALGQGINFYDALRKHACYEALEPVDAGVFTGNTGTNLCDFNILYVPARNQ